MTEAHRRSLYDFIAGAMHEYDFDRAYNYDDALKNFGTYEEFLAYQWNVINNVDVNTLAFLQQFQSLIQIKNIDLMDKEGGVRFEADGFFLDDGKIIFTNPR
jgi:hypothetical protein